MRLTRPSRGIVLVGVFVLAILVVLALMFILTQ